MPNIGKKYPNEITQMKRIKDLFGWSNSDISNKCVEFCNERPEYSPPSPRTIDKVFAVGSEEATFQYPTIKPLVAMSSYYGEQAGYNPDDSEITYEQAQLLRLIVDRKNARISELEKSVGEAEAKLSDQENKISELAERINDLETENADLKSRKSFFKTEYERAMSIIESLTKR